MDALLVLLLHKHPVSAFAEDAHMFQRHGCLESKNMPCGDENVLRKARDRSHKESANACPKPR